MKCKECRDLLWIYMEWEKTPEESAVWRMFITPLIPPAAATTKTAAAIRLSPFQLCRCFFPRPETGNRFGKYARTGRNGSHHDK